MTKIIKQKAQSTLEYVLMMTVIISVLLAILSPFGRMTRTVNTAIEVATQGIECMAEKTCYPGDPCPPKYAQCAAGAPILPSDGSIIAAGTYSIEYKNGTEDYNDCSQCPGGFISGSAVINPSLCGLRSVSSGDSSCRSGYSENVIYQDANFEEGVDCDVPTPHFYGTYKKSNCLPII